MKHIWKARWKARLKNQQGFTFVEVLAVVLVLGLLLAVAAPNYFGAKADALRSVDMANVRAINSALALYQARNSGACPTAARFPSFLADPAYFPDGRPIDPRTGTSTSYSTTYSATLCRVLMSAAGVNHDTGAGH